MAKTKSAGRLSMTQNRKLSLVNRSLQAKATTLQEALLTYRQSELLNDREILSECGFRRYKYTVKEEDIFGWRLPVRVSYEDNVDISSQEGPFQIIESDIDPRVLEVFQDQVARAYFEIISGPLTGGVTPRYVVFTEKPFGLVTGVVWKYGSREISIADMSSLSEADVTMGVEVG